jgi:glucose/arabinose dehydrogenase
LVNPVYVSRVPGDDSRLLVVEQGGTVRVIRNGELLPAPLLDISASVHESGEMGLLGLALHPDYRENRRLFVMYSTNPANESGDPHDAVLAEYSTSPADPDRVDESVPERRLLTVLEPEGNHNGGAIEFGSDGFLYVALGDGGGGGDEHGAIGNGQALDTLLGKILRIDVDSRGAGQYGIPAGNLADDNPAALPEIWSYGLRNPWRFSVDACTGDMYIADVGQDAFEEVNVEPAGTAGRNYGWRLMEAEACFNPATGCAADAQNSVLPVASYPHEGPGISGFSITGGYVYRGSAIPNLRGTYLYADFISNVLLALRMSGGELTLPQTSLSDNFTPGQGVQRISSFGQDNAGEVYVVSFGGSIYRIDPMERARHHQRRLAAALPGGATPGPPAPAGSQQASILGNRYAGSGACGNVYELVIYALGVGAFSPQNPDDPDAVEDEIARSAAVLATGSLRARSGEPNCGE